MSNPMRGRFAWHELMTTDPKAAKVFYTELCGWSTKDMDMGPMGTYTLFNAGEIGVGGMMKAQDGMPSNWLVYVGADDADATMKKIGAQGGKTLVPPTDVPDMVRFAIATDPQGAAFGVLKPLGPRANDPVPDNQGVENTFCWDELHTTDPKAAAAFYSTIFSWTGKVGDNDPMQYWHWQNDGKDIGGMMKLMMPNVPPHWLAYVAKKDVDAATKRVSSLGGKVMMEPMDIQKAGRFSVVQDPAGGTFALYQSAAK